MKLSARLMRHEDRGALDTEGIPVENEDRTLAERTMSLRAVVPYCLAILALAPSITHFAAAGQHFQDFWLFGVVTLIAAWLQLLWAVAVVVQPSRMLWWRVGAMLNSGIIVLDIATRAVGSAAGFGVAAAIVFEALVVSGCVWLLLSKRDQPIVRDGLVVIYGALGVVTATILSISLIAGGPAMANTAGRPTPALDRHGLQANVPLPAGVAFAGVHQTVRVPDMQYHSNISIDTWGWTARGSGAMALQRFYVARLPKQGWTHLELRTMGGYGNAKHLTACQSGEVLIVSTSSTKLDALDTTTGRATATVTAPHGGAALLIQIDQSPQAAQVACANSR